MATNAQWTPASTTQTSLTQTGLTPGTSYVLLVRAYKNNSDGTKSYSDYASIPFKASDVAPSGLNALTVNNGTDILLNGGSIFAQNATSPFPTNIGKFNVVTGTTTGTGVILNSTGIGAFKQGTKQFYIDASTGNAYFAGTVQATIIESTGYSGVTDGSAYSSSGTAINLNNGSITSKNFRIDTAGNAYFAGDVSSANIGATTLTSYITNTAQASANGKNTIFYKNFAPTNQPNTAGDTWFVFDSVSGLITSQYTGLGGTSWQTTQITNAVIANLDAGKITSGTISASIGITSPVITSGSVTASTISYGKTSASDTTHSGYYIGSTGNFMFGGTSNYLKWDGSSLSLTGSLYGPNGGISIVQDGSSYDKIVLGSVGSIIVAGAGLNIYGPNGVSQGIYMANGGAVNIFSTTNSINMTPSNIYLGASSTPSLSALRNISAQSGGTASGGVSGDVILIY